MHFCKTKPKASSKSFERPGVVRRVWNFVRPGSLSRNLGRAGEIQRECLAKKRMFFKQNLQGPLRLIPIQRKQGKSFLQDISTN